jgi:glycerol uptake facilitator-like aquaporin
LKKRQQQQQQQHTHTHTHTLSHTNMASSSYSYPLGAKALSEFVGMTLTIFFGESIIANELLPSTKGHGMGYLPVAFGFGLSFGVNIAWFGFISAHLNPAMFLFLAILGKVSWTEFVVCSLADFCGAFFGAVLVWLFYLPHFGFTSLPLPNEFFDSVANYLEGPVSYETNAGRLASAFGPASKPRKNGNLRGEVRDVFNPPTDQSFLDTTAGSGTSVSEEQKKLLEKMEVRRHRRMDHHHQLHSAPSSRVGLFRDNSANIAELLHERDPNILAAAGGGSNSLIDTTTGPRRHSAQVAGLLHVHDTDETGKSAEVMVSDRKTGGEHTAEADEEQANDNDDDGKPLDNKKDFQAYQAALQADARAKLSIFATRPAIFNRPYNFFQEAVCTLVLVFGAEMFNLRRETQSEVVTETEYQDGPFAQTIFVSFYITVLILGLGGVTGLAANPARDMGPRLAHFLLPIPGKGTSEWNYGLVVPLLGPFCGAAVGAGFFMLMERLFDRVEISGEMDL